MVTYLNKTQLYMSHVFTAELPTVHCARLTLKVVAHTCYVANAVAETKDGCVALASSSQTQ